MGTEIRRWEQKYRDLVSEYPGVLKEFWLHGSLVWAVSIHRPDVNLCLHEILPMPYRVMWTGYTPRGNTKKS